MLPPKPIYMGRYPVAGSGPDCKSGASQLGWFESNPAHQRRLNLLTKGSVAITSFLSTKIVAHLSFVNINFGGCIQKGNNVCRVG